ncbi:SGNH/GDSL hydrolase family protein [Sphingobacterium gobiense]|uniref:G-D-S-L family lipolytic protein n=1 Tax=Sphingobacterium gobiense TaxID=1382456 RepID=A0A2S9JTR8_9SPHI|nr:SGNH/GDSL hydrolase family protein [Sphingobacterium gobiense]PRD56685.1 G-D-S-L family lipolytic protein [Sphingobacterium gobiense]
MNRIYIVFLLCLGFAVEGHGEGHPSEPPFPIRDAKRILFLGNSITYAGHYVTLFESFLITAFPSSEIETINLGLPSETVSGLSEDGHAEGAFVRPWLFSRLDNVTERIKPDVVIACYGMNDGIYQPFSESNFQRYKEGMVSLYAKLKAAEVKRVVFITPSVHEDPILGLKGYNLVLNRYAQWLIDQRTERNWEVIDIHFPMQDYLTAKKTLEPDFKLAEDGIHPGLEGHRLIAEYIIPYFDDKFASKDFLSACLDNTSYYAHLYKLLEERQEIVKNAWLTYTGHNRPGLPVGLPLDKAKKESIRIQNKIQKLQKTSIKRSNYEISDHHLFTPLTTH